ncbi:MAG TPA: UvrD-helicase domain-containing protein [Acidimicrobiia bacterium]|nr:UvrD-helicase domain-containing protein [Acidimicrobiia bacterium]
MTRVPDESARRAISERLDESLFVEAGAGTGKTHELVGRVVALVGSGTPLERIAVITFTEAAAGELRDRVRGRLDVQARDAEDADVRTRCRRAVGDFDDAAITTLHGFAQRIIAEFPLEAGLPPGFEVLDEIEAQVQFAEDWNRFRDTLFEDPTLADAVTVCAILGIGAYQLESVARTIGDQWDRAVDWHPGRPPIPPVDAGPVLAAIDAAAALASGCTDDDDRLLARLGEVESIGVAVRDAADDLERLEVLAAWTLAGGNRGKKGNWPGDGKAVVLDRLAAAELARSRVVAATVHPAMTVLLDAVADFARGRVEARRRDGRLEFHDLLVHACRLLRSDGRVRAVLHERYRALLLDEFQDTDPLQIELAALIATTEADVAGKHWADLALAPGRVFVVGDPKQSIYRFRRADIELYRQVRDALGERLALTTNFRSRPAIVSYVDEVFSSRFGDDDPLQAPYDAPVASRPVPDHDSVRVFGAAAPKGTDLDALRRTEAEELASIVRRARAERWQVRDEDTPVGDDEGTRDVHYGDIAILLPTRTTLPYVEVALDTLGIPARVESQSLVFSTTEVGELLNVLTAIDDPVDDVSIVAALRSPGFACRDDELVAFVQAGGSWDYRRDAPESLPSDHAVVRALADLRGLHERRWWEGPSEIVARVIRERRLLELAVERARPRDHWRRIRFVADAARAYADAGGSSLRGFVTWARSQADEDARAVEVVVPEPDDDAVRILTVHGAKGLEFPVVVLTGLGLREQPRTGRVLFGPNAPLVSLRADSPFVDDGFDEVKEKEKAAWRAEQVRLLYVATTRAIDHLVVSMHHVEGDRCLAAHLVEASSSRPEIGRAAVGPEPTPSSPSTPGPDRDAWIEARTRAVAAGRRTPTISATAIARHEVPEREMAGHEVQVGREEAASRDEGSGPNEEDETPPWRRGRAGTAIGRAVHAVLQTVDLATGAGIDATARAQALAEGIPDQEDEIRALASSALDAPLVRDAVAGGWPRWREVPVAAPIDGVLVEGFIDLLVETPDGLVVADWKTDAVRTDAEVDTALARYRLQGATYALALEAVLGRAVTRCTFVFVGPDGARQREVDDLPGAVAEVRSLIRAVG